jgi:hypothetical protein
MDKKNERIIGLVVGLIGLFFLFHFNFSHMKISSNGSFIANICKDIMEYLYDDRWGRNTDYLFYFIQLISILFVWFYRACIGHWALKSVRVFYKKI